MSKKEKEKDHFADSPFGVLALKKLQKRGPLPENFRLFSAGWMGKDPEDWTAMKVIGAVFREAKTGPNKGKLSIMVEGTKREVFVTEDEMQAFEAIKKAGKKTTKQPLVEDSGPGL